MSKFLKKKKDKGQVLVIMAISLFALLMFVGLAIDGTQLFLNYTRLKRAVDSAAVAAANDFRRGVSLDQMKAAAQEILDMQQVTDDVNIQVYMCDLDGDGTTDIGLASSVPDFYKQCPKAGQSKKKLIYVRAFEDSQTNFLTLLGIHSVPITTTAISEAAPVDLMIVLDTSMSMGSKPDPITGLPISCNTNTDPQCPLKGARDAAVSLINKLYPAYDRVGIVSYDTVGVPRYDMADAAGLAGAISVLNNPSGVPLHIDPDLGLLPSKWTSSKGQFNPINPEDRNNDGLDNDASITCQITNPLKTPDPADKDRWDYGTGRNIPCDNLFNDTLDWQWNGTITDNGGVCNAGSTDDDCLSRKWMTDHNPPLNPALSPPLPISFVSTCTGCGIRVATDMLTKEGRTNAVWVMVFLSDGVVNMSDTAQTFPYNATTKMGVPTTFPNGYCGGQVVVNIAAGVTPNPPNYWLDYCRDNTGQRRCINTDPLTCPPGSTPVSASPPYSVMDYAKDMTDVAVLRKSTNNKEKLGNDIAIYTIMFTSRSDMAAQGAPLLRYMADVGDDGDRDTHPCKDLDPSNTDPTHPCGQYYYAGDSDALARVFLDIASRIYSKISE
jgi:Flp pilus assembly protein TadG